MKAIFGLGNPGYQYRNSRHNVGYKVVEAIAKDKKVHFQKNFRLKANILKLKINRKEVILIKPLTFMNNSGECVRAVIEKYGIPKEDFLVVYDDLDLPLGVIRFREKGSGGGHKGFISIKEALGTQEINRLRVGIGKPKEGDTVEYVLSDFLSEEKEILNKVILRAASACRDWVIRGGGWVMSIYNYRGGQQ